MKRFLLPAALLVAAIATPQTNNIEAWYRGYNHKYFHDELPADVVITEDLRDDTLMARTDHEGTYYHIRLNPKFAPSFKQERATLLHEDCHIWQMVSNEVEFDDHGPKWQACMHDLAKQGAFDDVW